MLDGLAFTKKQ